DGLDVRRRQGANHEFGGIIGPKHDVHLFATQFITHGRHTRTPHTHTTPDRIDALVVSDDRNFGAYTGIARSSLDLHQPLFDLGNFVFEQLDRKSTRLNSSHVKI